MIQVQKLIWVFHPYKLFYILQKNEIILSSFSWNSVETQLKLSLISAET